MNNPDLRELHDLVRAMHQRFTPGEIGDTLGYSAQAIRDVLVKLGITERRRPFAERFQRLDPALRERIKNFATQRRERHQQRRHA